MAWFRHLEEMRRFELRRQKSVVFGFVLGLLFLTMENLRIEAATLDDLPELTEMLFELFSQEQDFVPDREKQKRGLRLVLEDPSRGRIFVLRSPGKIIGMINLLITISTAEGSFVMVLEDMFIDQAHRGQGYGKRLLKHAIKFAKKRNFLRITLLTDQPDEPQKHFYLKNGFIQSNMVPMRMHLRSDAS